MITIIGGGAAGFFSAIHNKLNAPDSRVIIIEKSSEVLAKVKISGGGRCNVTHACFDPRVLMTHYPRGGKALLGPFHRFGPQDTMAWFEAHGVPLKIEKDYRVFPVSDSSQSISDCLVNTAKQLGISIWNECAVTQISKTDTGFELLLSSGARHECHKLVLATGSSRMGHDMAKQLGHTIVPPIPSLFTLTIADPDLHARSGLSVAETEVCIATDKKHSQKGPLLITHWGMSGPSIIKLSAWKARELHALGYRVPLWVNWLPHLTSDQIRTTLSGMHAQHPKKMVVGQSPFSEIPHRLWDYLATKATQRPRDCWQAFGKKQLDQLHDELRQSPYPVTGKGAFKEEFVTCGGVALNEVNFKTMESKCCPGLYLVGELLDIDGVTGGFNFQNAWTTGFLSSNYDHTNQ